MSHKIYLYPVWLRIWHGINALGILILIVTGISMQYATAGSTFLKFSLAVDLHNIFGIIVSVNYLFFLLGNIFTKNARFYKIDFTGFVGKLIKQGQYYMFGMFRGQKPPFPVSEKRKFNPLQKMSYVGVMVFVVPFLIVSGVALLFPEFIIDSIYNCSGIFLTALFHTVAGFIVLVFLMIHLYVSTIGKHPMQHFKSIVNGWHEE